jgi:hypothetical protein
MAEYQTSWQTPASARLRKSLPRLVLRLNLISLPMLLVCSAWAQTAGTTNRQVTSLGTEIEKPGNEPLHILYIHGIGAIGQGDSESLRISICKHALHYLHQACTTADGTFAGREYADQGIFDISNGPPPLDYMGSPAWSTPDEWHAAAPFVDHWLITLTGGKSILVDEINWWPLVFSVKCQHIMPNETNLAGSLAGKYTNFLGICAQQRVHVGDGVTGRYDFYNWLAPLGMDPTTLNQLHKNSVPINRWAKAQIMDWNFSDALLGVGPLEDYLVEGIRQLLIKCVAKGAEETAELTSRPADPKDPNAQFIIISHSLGSFLILSSYQSANDQQELKFISLQERKQRDQVFCYLMGRLSQVYFFANQIPLLELARMSPPDAKDYLDLSAWAGCRRTALGPGNMDPAKPLGQIVSWSDPNDLLTWYLGADFKSWQASDQSDILVVNNLVKNATTFNWLWLFENPDHAHNDYAKNRVVIRSLLQPLQ